MARTTGTFTFPSNFEVTKAAPLDARASTPLKSELTDGSLPFPYLGMLVAVTEDSTSNTGLYYSQLLMLLMLIAGLKLIAAVVVVVVMVP
jgi:hypothetical protein